MPSKEPIIILGSNKKGEVFLGRKVVIYQACQNAISFLFGNTEGIFRFFLFFLCQDQFESCKIVA